MPTGACGINCDVCGLNIRGVCSSCGPGGSDTAAAKLVAQERIMGAPCPVLACARLNHIAFCLCDCRQFPCSNFSQVPYPFSQGFIDMQQRRRDESPKAYAPDGSHLVVDPIYWQELSQKEITHLCNHTFFEAVGTECLQFQFLNETIRIDLRRQCLLRPADDGWQVSDDPLLALATVVYLKNIKQIYPMGKDIVGIKDLKGGHFFVGPHQLRLDPLIKRFGNDLEGFQRAGQALNGRIMEMADAAFLLLPYPRVPLYYLLWAGDSEFKPRIQVLVDRTIEQTLPADAIWALINRVSAALGQ
jgi:hypothetical protein